MSKRGSILGCLKLSWAILKPSWEHIRSKCFLEGPLAQKTFGRSDFFLMVWLMMWTILDDFRMILDDFVDHFLVTFWIPFGDHFGTHFRTRASKTKKATFSKKWFSRGTVYIFSLLRPPKELLNPKKKGSKIGPKINKF